MRLWLLRLWRRMGGRSLGVAGLGVAAAVGRGAALGAVEAAVASTDAGKNPEKQIQKSKNKIQKLFQYRQISNLSVYTKVKNPILS